jgi:tRNA-modifying protein YgfZ
MRTECIRVSLASLGVLRARGADVRGFLQGQLSNDLTRLDAQHSLLAGYHNPQGRVIALLRVLEVAPEDVLAVLPRELIAVVGQRLTKYILRAKVKLADESAAWTVTGVVAPGASAPPAGELPAVVHGAAGLGESLAVRVAQDPARWLVVSPAGAPPALTGCTVAAAEVWQRAAIASGEPQVYAATSEQFVAQMLNLDVLGAIAFDKGCYTGQEVVARAHYRGRVKRRLQRFVTREERALSPGMSAELADGRALRVVDAAQLRDGRCEFLAVTSLLPAQAAGAGSAAAPGATGTPGIPDTPATGSAPRIDTEQLALPYVLPE